MSESATLPSVTILVPCRDEIDFIEDCLQSIIENGYPEDKLQVLVIDGRSTDGTTEIVERFSQAHHCVTRIENAARITPAALNLGIAAARGDYIIWMSAHNRYDAGYVQACVEWALRSGADNVGGGIVTKPRHPTYFGRAVAEVLTHPFGVGNSTFRTSASKPAWVDTVFGGCYRRDVFDRVGLFNERLVRGQDLEFNLRLRRAGLRTLFVPTIRSIYYARSRPLEFASHNWTNGVWAILPFRYSDIVPISVRHMVPMFFVIGILLTAIIGFVAHGLWWPFFLLLTAYFALALVATVLIARRERDLRVVAFLPLVFTILHLSYGLGSLWGATRSVRPLAKHIWNAGRRVKLKEAGSSPL
jgi:glycosyltransferase involved in cell wall biosynthesis